MNKKYFEKKPNFISAAIKIKGDMVFTGARHHMIFEKIMESGFWNEYLMWNEQGFVIDDGNKKEFVNRNEATEIAKFWKMPMIGSILTSEDLW